MKTVLVTGSNGFVGKNLCARLEQEKNIKVLRFSKDNSPEELEQFLGESDFIFHTAGVNRPKDEAEFETGNHGLTEQILSILEKNNKKTPVLLTSSTQAQLDNPYGNSKKAAEEAVSVWAEKAGAEAYIYRLPGVFGKWCKPNYNSVIATFCYNIAHGLDIQINDPASELTIVYIDDVVSDFLKAMRGEKKISANGLCHIPRSFTVTLQELSDKLRVLRDSRTTMLVPSFEDDFERFLYATYISYLPEKEFGYPLDMKSDDRGAFAEFIKSDQFGQINVSRTKPGFTRGLHWHNTKIEKFLVLEGEAEIKLRRVYSDKIITRQVSGSKLEVVEMPAGYIHSIKNTGKVDMILLIWTQEIFNPEQPDTYFKEI